MTTHAVALKPTEADAYLPAQEKFAEIVTQLRAPQTQEMTHSEVEQLVETELRELGRRLVQAHLDERGPALAVVPVVDAEGRQHTHLRLQTRALETIFGPVTLRRYGYGGRGLQSLHPLDAELNLPPDHHSHTVRQRVAEAAAKGSFDEVVSTLTSYTGAQVAKRQAETLAARAAQDFNPFYEQREVAAPEAFVTGEVLVINADGKGVPLLKRGLRPATQAAAEKQAPHLKRRRSKGEKPHRKRMATVAAVYTLNPWVRRPDEIVRELHPGDEPLTEARPRPEDKRVWASLKQSPEEVITQAFEEAARRDPQQHKQWVALVDGNPTQLSLLQTAAAKWGVALVIILDLIHVLEYLWKAAWAFFDEGDPAAEAWVSERLEAVLRGRSSQVAAGLRRSATLRGLSQRQRALVDRGADYLLKHREFLRYDKYLEAGYPIATGVIEGACRYLVKDRMELTGARWSLDGAEAVLRLRALRASGDFEEYWKFHLEQEQKRHHATHYANEKAPEVTHKDERQGKTSHLRLVK
jgi:hypothetical protein